MGPKILCFNELLARSTGKFMFEESPKSSSTEVLEKQEGSDSESRSTGRQALPLAGVPVGGLRGAFPVTLSPRPTTVSRVSLSRLLLEGRSS